MLTLLLTLLAVQRVETGFLDRSITVAGRSYRYQVYVPADYQSKSSWPAILFLHGAGERGDDGLLQTNVGLAPAIRQNPSRYPAIAIFPQVPRDSQWVGAPGDMATALYHYNPTGRYVRAVTAYAEQIRGNRRVYLGYYHWQVYYGDTLLPEGYPSRPPSPPPAEAPSR